MKKVLQGLFFLNTACKKWIFTSRYLQVEIVINKDLMSLFSLDYIYNKETIQRLIFKYVLACKK